MINSINLYDSVIDKKTGIECVVVYISDDETDDCYLVEPVDYSFDPDWRELKDLIVTP